MEPVEKIGDEIAHRTRAGNSYILPARLPARARPDP